MSDNKKPASKRFLSASAKIRKIERKLDNGIYSDRKEERLYEQLAKAKDKKAVAELELKHPAAHHTSKQSSFSSTVNFNNNSKHVHVHVKPKKKDK